MCKSPSGRFRSCSEFADAMAQSMSAPGNDPQSVSIPTQLAMGPAGPPPGQTSPSGPMFAAQPAKRNWMPVIVAAVAIVLVLGLAALAVVLIPKFTGDKQTNIGAGGASSSTVTTTTSSQNRTTSAAASDASARLMSALPAGYGAGGCNPIVPVTDAVATVECKQNSKPGGPGFARYSLFRDQSALDSNFTTSIRQDEQLLSCPGSDAESPNTWHYTSTPDQVEGQVACGTYKGRPDIAWTRNNDLLLGDAQGSDLAAMHDWWLQFG
jgi:hypothetical protein